MPQSFSRHFTLKTLNEVPELSFFLAREFPKPENYRVGIYELLVNAIEHGNLGLGFQLKSTLLNEGKWEDEINHRLTLPPYRDRRVAIRLERNKKLCRLTIQDQGQGFPWMRWLDTISSGRRPNGRGLLIALDCKFEQFTFNPTGNKITCVANYD